MNNDAQQIADMLCRMISQASRRKSTSANDVVTVPVQLMIEAQELIRQHKDKLTDVSPVRLNYVIAREF